MQVASPAPSRPRRPARARRWLGWLIVIVVVAIPLYFIFRVQLTVPPVQALRAGDELLAQKTVLAIVGHPDDLEWYVGGTLRRLADNGANDNQGRGIGNTKPRTSDPSRSDPTRHAWSSLRLPSVPASAA